MTNSSGPGQTVKLSRRFTAAALVFVALVWLVEFFEMRWMDGAAMREHNWWYPYLTWVLVAAGLGCCVASMVWRRRGR